MSDVSGKHTVAVCLWMRNYFSDTVGDTSNRHLAIIVALTVLLLLKYMLKYWHILQTGWDCAVEKAERKQANWTPMDGKTAGCGKSVRWALCQDVLNGARSSVIMPLLQGERHMIIVSQFWKLFNLHFGVNAWATKKEPAADSGLFLFHLWDCFPTLSADWLIPSTSIYTEWADGFPQSLTFCVFIGSSTAAKKWHVFRCPLVIL